MRQFDVAKMRASCRLAAQALVLARSVVRPGITTDDINRHVHNFIVKNGAYPAPLNYRGFPKSVCTSVNDVVCHGIPGKLALKEGDIVNVDVTTILDGHFGDTSATFLVGSVDHSVMQLVDVTLEATLEGIRCIGPGMSVASIGDAVGSVAEKHGYGVVKEFGGHGLGTRFHTEPFVSHCRSSDRHDTVLRPGMCLTVEPMLTMGPPDVWLESDKWTVRTQDGRPSAQWEHTVLVTDNGHEVLTMLPE